MTRMWVPVVSVLLLCSLIINAEVIYQNGTRNGQMKYAETYGMDHVVANIEAANGFMNKDREYSATQIAEAAGELVTLSKIIPIDSSNTSNYAWKIGYYLHAHSTDVLKDTRTSDSVTNYIKQADAMLSAHTKSGHYDMSYLSHDLTSIGEITPNQ